MPYPAAPGKRMAYDRDGSAGGWWATGSSIVSMSGADLQNLNNEASDNLNSPVSSSGPGTIAAFIIFPELRDIVGWFIRGSGQFGLTPANFQWSANTTTGLDGTWTDITANWGPLSSSVNPDYRTSINTVSLTGVKGVRMLGTAASGSTILEPFALHLYGGPSSGQNPDSLRIWQPVKNAEVTGVLDEGDIARGTSNTLTFRVHNQSGTKTAHSVTISAEALTDASTSLLGQYLFSTDNITYASSLSLGDLGPGATTAVLYVRDNVDPAAALGPWAARIVASASSFS